MRRALASQCVHQLVEPDCVEDRLAQVEPRRAEPVQDTQVLEEFFRQCPVVTDKCTGFSPEQTARKRHIGH